MSNIRSKLRTLLLVSALVGGPAVTAHADDISFNGFGSAYYGQAVNAGFLPVHFASTHADFTNFSLMGLNVGARLSDNLTFASQLLALGNPIGTTDSFGVIAQWAYLKYVPMDGMSIKAGRQLLPWTMAAEYARVGYLLPYRATPISLFVVPFSRFDGVSVDQRFDVGVGQLTVGAYFGTPQLDLNSITTGNAGVTFYGADAVGVVATLDGDGWRVRGQYGVNYGHEHYDFSAHGGPVGDLEGHRRGYSLGGRYDKHDFVFWGEWLGNTTPDGTRTSYGGKFLENSEGYYGLVGYRLGKFMPRYTYAHGGNNLNLSGPNGENWSGRITQHVIGVNYQAGSQAVVKLEYERQSIPVAGGSGNYSMTQQVNGTATRGDALYLGVDFIF